MNKNKTYPDPNYWCDQYQKRIQSDINHRSYSDEDFQYP